MTVYCPKCGYSYNLWPQSDPEQIGGTDERSVMRQLERCGNCRHVWWDRWVVVHLPDGSIETEDITERDD